MIHKGPRDPASVRRGRYALLIPTNTSHRTDRRSSRRAATPSPGRLLAALSVVPALALSGWLAAGLPLLLLGWFRPLPMALLGGGLAVLLCVCGLRRLPETPQATGWRTFAVVGVAVASGVFNGIFHGEQLIVRRDPSTYAQYAIWLARHGSLPMPLGDFGGPDPALRFDSMGFYQVGDGIVPQFMAGPPMIHAIGAWLAGVPGLLLVPPVLGALAVLTFAGTAARLAGARWAAPAALAVAVSLPIIYTSRTTFSEIPSMILMFGGMNLLLDARSRLRAAPPAAPGPMAVIPEGGTPGGLAATGPARSRGARSRGARMSAALAGLAFGLALLVRIDGLRDVLPVLAFAGVLIALNRISRTRAVQEPRRALFPDGRLGLPLLAGLVAGSAWGFAAAYGLARPYLKYLSGSLTPLLAICAVVLALTLAGTAMAPWLRTRLASRLSGGPAAGRWARRLPDVAAALVVLVMAGLAVRPWVQTVRRVAVTQEDKLTATFIRATQQADHLPLDGTRLYYEDSLHWVFWYVGIPVVVLAMFGAAVLVRRIAQGKEFGWVLPLAIIGWTTVTTLWRPAITADHPWASRRLAPVVIPGLILLAAWAVNLLRERAARRSVPRTRAVAAAGVALLVVPAAITSIGTAFTPVNRGEAAAAAGLCAAIPKNASVLIVERVTGDRVTQLVRGECGVPVARVRHHPPYDVAPPADVLRLIAAVRRTGRVPVLLAADPLQLFPYGSPRQVMKLRTRQDERSLVDPPDGTWSLSVDVWMTIPAR